MKQFVYKQEHKKKIKKKMKFLLFIAIVFTLPIAQQEDGMDLSFLGDQVSIDDSVNISAGIAPDQEAAEIAKEDAEIFGTDTPSALVDIAPDQEEAEIAKEDAEIFGL